MVRPLWATMCVAVGNKSAGDIYWHLSRHQTRRELRAMREEKRREWLWWTVQRWGSSITEKRADKCTCYVRYNNQQESRKVYIWNIINQSISVKSRDGERTVIHQKHDHDYDEEDRVYDYIEPAASPQPYRWGVRLHHPLSTSLLLFLPLHSLRVPVAQPASQSVSSSTAQHSKTRQSHRKPHTGRVRSAACVAMQSWMVVVVVDWGAMTLMHHHQQQPLKFVRAGPSSANIQRWDREGQTHGKDGVIWWHHWHSPQWQ